MVDLEQLLPALSQAGVEFPGQSRPSCDCYCLGLDRLIQAKRDAGRPKDLEAIAELEALREE